MTAARTTTGVTAVLASLPTSAVHAARVGSRVVITAPGIRIVLTREQADALGYDLIRPAPTQPVKGKRR